MMRPACRFPVGLLVDRVVVNAAQGTVRSLALLGTEPLQAAPLGGPLGLDRWASTMPDAGIADVPTARTLPLWMRSDSAESVSSM